MRLHVYRAFALSIALLVSPVFVLEGCAEMQEKAQEKYVLVKEKVQEKVRVMVEQAGACCFVGKPIKEDDLTNALAKAAQS